MAHISVILTAIVGGSYLVFLLLDYIITSRRVAAKAEEWGCKEPPEQRNRLPLGIDKVMDSMAADEKKLFPEYMVGQADKMGVYTWSYRLFGTKIISTHDPQNIQAILATQFGTFDLGEQRRATFWPMLGNGIFTQSGADWKHSREMMRPQFTRDQVSDLDLEERHVQNMMSALDAKLKPDGWTNVVDLQALFFRLTLDSATEFLLGESADTQLQHIPDYPRSRNSAEALHNVDFAWAFDRGQWALAQRARLGPQYYLYTSREFRKCIRQCNSFMDHYVRRALNKDLRQAEKEVEANPKPKFVFLDALAEKTRDPIELRSQIMHMLLAGRDTTASTLGYLFMLLSRDPVRYKKLRDTIIEDFGTYAQPKEITFSKLKNCQPLQYCLNETLRLHPIVPINGRQAYKDTKLPVGGGPDGKSPVFVRKGQSVEYCVHILHRRKDIWGPDADEFIPERWENKKVGWEYVPFNGGPRICLGQQFALTEASYVTVRLLQRFEAMENREPDPVVRHNLTLTTCSANGVKVSLRAAGKQ
ncbi:cytochrome P450 [Cryphonectria parasitica EP155]|uniref:Cytochrome P450 n=1 Tax=Cryphonectria parasitica (strain ATCC 38755 / EP155) TaxID=660469 RepID=A0A9P4Y7W3_CRYP1|nr:cytochrome P450 [Cryphonectria parasitica EP155]KAF3768116.1 cytochrome P450 [Cryphonectria parasitica EP155]